MKVVNPSWEILGQDGTLAERIERAGRLAYKSEDKITPTSANKFVRKICESGHMPVMELAVAHLVVTLPGSMFLGWMDSRSWNDAKYLSCTLIQADANTNKATLLLTGTCRGLIDFLSAPIRAGNVSNTIMTYLYNLSDIVFAAFEDYAGDADDEMSVRRMGESELYSMWRVDDNDAIYSPNMSKREYMNHQYVMVKFVCSRAVSHEIVRHRPCSFIQESQRYCRYSQDKFGKEVTFINPQKVFGFDDQDYPVWENAMLDAESRYFFLLETHSPQVARLVLPNSCKTEIIVFANLTEWQHIFNMRVSKSAEPSMRELTVPLQQEMLKRFPMLKEAK